MQPQQPLEPQQPQPPVAPLPAPEQPVAVPTPMPQAAPALQQSPVPEAAPELEVAPQGPSELPAQQHVQWQAAEYVQHDKSPLWYVVFGLALIGLVVIAVFFMQSWTFAILIPVMAVALMVYSHRPPRQLTYVVSQKGLHINGQLHPLGEFKGFGVIQEGADNALVLIPVKRFRPSVTVHFPTEIGEQLVDILGAYIPMKEVHPDAFDKIVQKLRI